eukprot:6631511-Pyramimonas_sp.AAC.1
MEAMKMVMPLVTQHSGQITFEMAAGDVVEAGTLVARLQLVDTASPEQQGGFRGGGGGRCPPRGPPATSGFLIVSWGAGVPMQDARARLRGTHHDSAPQLPRLEPPSSNSQGVLAVKDLCAC